ncbi:MAG: hypothetical protein NZ455_12405 [Bacteroidia bacterium]|nr:hypothetical protein [Bacteroidia bacterium]
MRIFFFCWACPSLRSGRRAAGYAIASVLRTADAPSACLTQAAFVCFTLFVCIPLLYLVGY